MRRSCVLVLMLVMLSAAPARADEVVPPPPLAEPVPAPPALDQLPAPTPPPVVDPPPAVDPVWAAYDHAFVLAAAGNLAAARAELEQLRAAHPDHPAVGRAATRLDELDVVEASAATARRAGPSRVARGELILSMTVSGAMLAGNICVERCTENREWAAAVMLSSGAALGLTVAATRHGVRSGEAQLYSSAMTWGSWNGLGVNDGLAETSAEGGYAIGAQIGGLAAGVGLWQADVWRPSAGDVALTNTAFGWATVLTLYGHLAANEEPTMRTIVAAGDAGIVLGAVLSTEVEMSRGRTLLIDVGGILGSLAGGLVAVAADDEQVAGGGLLVGSVLGLGLATAATQHWDDDVDAPKVRVAPMPVPHGGVGGTLAFDF